MVSIEELKEKTFSFGLKDNKKELNKEESIENKDNCNGKDKEIKKSIGEIY